MKISSGSANEIEFETISPKNYYLFLYREIFERYKDAIIPYAEYFQTIEIPKPKWEMFDAQKKLLSDIQEKYGLRMQINYPKFYLWQKCFREDTDYNAILAASYLIEFGLLTDFILDSRQFSEEQKRYVCEKRGLLALQMADETEFQELNQLFAGYSAIMDRFEEDNLFRKTQLLDILYRSFDSEVYMYESELVFPGDMQDTELLPLVNKSILFEKAAMIVAIYGFTSADAIYAAELVGRVFWLTDDLCDFVDDIKSKRKNSLLIFCAEKRNFDSFEERLENVFCNMQKAIAELEYALKELRSIVSKDFFSYILVQVWKWFTPIWNTVEHHRNHND